MITPTPGRRWTLHLTTWLAIVAASLVAIILGVAIGLNRTLFKALGFELVCDTRGFYYFVPDTAVAAAQVNKTAQRLALFTFIIVEHLADQGRDPVAVLDGGSLGWRKGAQLPTLFADIVIRMKPGEFSEPIQSTGGFQIVRLNDMRGAERTMVDQLHVRHILLRPNEILDESAVQQKMRGIRDQIAGGDDFATVAKSVSEDTQSAADGGDLGWVSPGDTVPEFEQALADMPLRQLSEPIKSRFGWHLVEVLERRSHDTTDEVKRDQCARQIRSAKAEEERERWLRRLRDQAFVQIKR